MLHFSLNTLCHFQNLAGQCLQWWEWMEKAFQGSSRASSATTPCWAPLCPCVPHCVTCWVPLCRLIGYKVHRTIRLVLRDTFCISVLVKHNTSHALTWKNFHRKSRDWHADNRSCTLFPGSVSSILTTWTKGFLVDSSFCTKFLEGVKFSSTYESNTSLSPGQKIYYFVSHNICLGTEWIWRNPWLAIDPSENPWLAVWSSENPRLVLWPSENPKLAIAGSENPWLGSNTVGWLGRKEVSNEHQSCPKSICVVWCCSAKNMMLLCISTCNAALKLLWTETSVQNVCGTGVMCNHAVCARAVFDADRA